MDIAAKESTLPLTGIRARRTTKRAPVECLYNSTFLQDMIAGGIAGSAGIIVGHPFDTIKVRLQMGQQNVMSPLIHLFRGVGAPVATAALVNATIFSSFACACRLAEQHQIGDLGKNIAGGTAAGIASSLVLCPSEHVKVRLQSTQEQVYRHSLDAAVQITKVHGISGLYRGLVATITRQVPAFVIYFGAYDFIKEQCRKRLPHKSNDWLGSILAGGTAGSLSWAAIYPIDLVKSRIQSLPLTAECKMYNVFQAVLQETGGWRSLYRGLSITVLRAFPVNGIIFCTYEMCLSKMSSLNKVLLGEPY